MYTLGSKGGPYGVNLGWNSGFEESRMWSKKTAEKIVVAMWVIINRMR